MKFRQAAVVATVVVAVLVLVQCDWTVGGAPRDVRLAADSSGTGVLVVWTEPGEGSPEAYHVYFRRAPDSGFQKIAETDDTLYHDQLPEMTGVYRVEALFGRYTYRGGNEPSTIPVFTDTTTLAVLGETGNPGYGWSRQSGAAKSYAMIDVAETLDVDLYATTYGTDSIFVFSPDYAPGDTSGTVPPAEGWRENYFTPDLPPGLDTVPGFDGSDYEPFRALDALPMELACYTDDGRYGLLRVVLVNEFTGDVLVQSWFQPVAGLRLLRQ